MSSPDDWAYLTRVGTPASKAEERAQLAVAMAEYEAKHGPVATSPIQVHDVASIKRGWQEQKLATAPPSVLAAREQGKTKRPLTPLLHEVLTNLRAGYSKAPDISRRMKANDTLRNAAISNIRYALDRLVEIGLARRIKRATYAPIPMEQRHE